MAHPLAMLAIGLVLGGGVGFTLAAANGVTLDGHDHATHGLATHEARAVRTTPAASIGPAVSPMPRGSSVHARDHAEQATLELAPGTDAPTLRAWLTPDPVSGWNLRLATRNFRFAPERAGNDHEDGEGHAHVYVDGAKVARLYGAWLHLPALAPDAVVEVSLNANDHRPLAVAGRPLRVRAERKAAGES